MTKTLRAILSLILSAAMVLLSLTSPIQAKHIHQEDIVTDTAHDHQHIFELEEKAFEVSAPVDESGDTATQADLKPVIEFKGEYVHGNQTCELPVVTVTARGGAYLTTVTYRDIYSSGSNGSFKGTIATNNQETVTFDLKEATGTPTGYIIITATDSNGNTSSDYIWNVHVRGSYNTASYPATCNDPAREVTVSYCAYCGEAYSTLTTYSKTDVATGHSFSKTEVEICDMGTVIKETCDNCGYVQFKQDGDIADVVTDKSHTWSDTLTVVDATCGNDGVSYYECEVCGAVKDVTYIPLVTHKYTAGKTYPATCTDDGYTERTCSVCGSVDKRDVVPALGHDYKVDEELSEATCEGSGLAKATCSRCGDVNDSYATPALGHSYEFRIAKEATCDKPGLQGYYCIRCDALQEGTETEVQGPDHTYVDDGDCTTPVTCDVCGNVVIEAKSEHVYRTSMYSYYEDADSHWRYCTNDGCKQYLEERHRFTGKVHCTESFICEDCGYHVKANTYSHSFTTKFVSDASGHYLACDICGAYSTSYRVKHTVFDDGDCTTDLNCSVCGYLVMAGEESHKFGDWVDEGDDPAVHTKDCINDGCTYQEVEPHNYELLEVNVVQASCLLDGSYDLVNVCKDCGARVVVETGIVIKSNGHKFGEWEIMDPSNCDDSGTEFRTCEICKYVETKNLDASGHTYTEGKWVTVKEPTCTATGSEAIFCEKCGEAIFSREIERKGHNWSEFVSEDNATCTVDGTLKSECLNGCGEVQRKIDEGSATGHSYGEFVSNNNATCFENGTKSHTCDICGYTEIVEDEGSMLTHEFLTYVFEEGSATCDHDGVEVAQCIHRCGETDERPAEGTRLEHRFTNYIYQGDATCLDDGTEVAVCDRDGCEATDEKTAENTALGHSWIYYIPDGDATCTEDGHETSVCEREGCNETDTRIAVGSATGHTPGEYSYDHNATCEVNGTESTFCTVCGEPMTREADGTALGHSFTHYVYDGSVRDCEEDGTETAVCDNGCGLTDTRDVPAGSHTLGEFIYNDDATCTEDGTETAVCEVCYKEVTRVKEGTALGHSFVDGVCERCNLREEMILGDINGDGEVDIRDGVLMQRILADIETNADYILAADLNGDNKVDVSDGVLMQRILAKLEI